MQNHLALEKHSGNMPDPRKNEHKWEKLRVRVAKMETELDVMQRDALAEVIALMTPGQLRGVATQMNESDLTTCLKLLTAEQRRGFLADIGTPQLVHLISRIAPDEREKILEMMDIDQRRELERQIPARQRGQGRHGKSDFYDVMGRFWTYTRGEPPYRWSSGGHMVRQIDERSERANEGGVAARIAEMVTDVRAQQSIAVNKRERLEQLSISPRKKTLRRIRLLRSGNTPNKMVQASQMMSRLTAEDAGRRQGERAELARQRRRRMHALLAEPSGNGAVPAGNGAVEPVAAEADAQAEQPERELFGGVEHVPQEYRKWR